MRKSFIYAILIFTISIFLTSCKKEVKNNLTETIYFIENIESIKDSIIKLKTYHVKLAICSLKKINGFNEVTITTPNIPYFIENKFAYKNINGTNVLFIDYNEKVSNKKILKNILSNNIVTFEGNSKYIDPPFLKFVFCENDYKRIKCFDNIMQNNIQRECLQKRIIYNDSLFYPKCK